MKDSFKNLIHGEHPVLIDFYATWCGPCKALAPVLKEVAKELKGDVRVIKIDIDKNQELAQKLNIRSVPTLWLMHQGEQLWSQAGGMSKGQLLNAVRSAIS